jgi:hypothetical protein
MSFCDSAYFTKCLIVWRIPPFLFLSRQSADPAAVAAAAVSPLSDGDDALLVFDADFLVVDNLDVG